MQQEARGSWGLPGKAQGNVLLSWYTQDPLPLCPRTPFFQEAMTLSVDMTITHRVLSKAQTQEPQLTLQPVKQGGG